MGYFRVHVLMLSRKTAGQELKNLRRIESVERVMGRSAGREVTVAIRPLGPGSGRGAGAAPHTYEKIRYGPSLEAWELVLVKEFPPPFVALSKIAPCPVTLVASLPRVTVTGPVLELMVPLTIFLRPLGCIGTSGSSRAQISIAVRLVANSGRRTSIKNRALSRWSCTRTVIPELVGVARRIDRSSVPVSLPRKKSARMSPLQPSCVVAFIRSFA